MLAIPSLFGAWGSGSALAEPGGCASARINLGLDIAGGSQLLLEADITDAAKQRLQAMEDESPPSFAAANRAIQIGDVSTCRRQAQLRGSRSNAACAAAFDRMQQLTQPVGPDRQPATGRSAASTATRIVLTPTEAGAKAALKNSLTVARDVVRRRIDPGGTKEITVINQGDRPDLRPGSGCRGSRSAEASDRPDGPARVQAGRPQRRPRAGCRRPFSSQAARSCRWSTAPAPSPCKRRVMVSGEQLVDAKQGVRPGRTARSVSITFNAAGARRFGRVTQENVGKPFAIILDDKVLSAPQHQ